jgi:hypothetical protein
MPALMVYAGMAAAYFFDRDRLTNRLGDVITQKPGAARLITFIFLSVAFLLFAFHTKL